MVGNRLCYTRAFYLLFIILRSPCFAEALGKWIMINFKLSNLLILISCHGNKLGFFEDISSEGGVGKLENVAGSHKMEPRLVFVH